MASDNLGAVQFRYSRSRWSPSTLGAATSLTPFDHLTGRPPTLHQARAISAGPLLHLKPIAFTRPFNTFADDLGRHAYSNAGRSNWTGYKRPCANHSPCADLRTLCHHSTVTNPNMRLDNHRRWRVEPFLCQGISNPVQI